MVTLTDQSLVVHLVAATTGPRRETSYRLLRELWAACGTGLGMARPVVASGLPDALPESAEGLPAPGAVAARRSRDGRFQAILLRHHDLLHLSVALSPAPGEQGSWAEWDRRWAEVRGDTGEWAVGEARLYVAYRGDDGAGGGGTTAGPPDLEDAVRAGLPYRSPAPRPRLGAGVRVVRPPVTVWEVAGEAGAEHVRRFAAVAVDRGDEPRDVERWLWHHGGGAPAPFARYLAAAAEVRYETRVHAAPDGGGPGSPDHGGAGALVDRALGALDRPATAEDDDRAGELAGWRNRLLALTAGSSGLTQRITRVREMRTTVGISEATLRARRDAAGVPADARGFFAEDLALAQWFVQRLTDDLVYLEADRERARDAVSVLALEAENVLQHRRELTQQRERVLQRRQGTLNLLQSAFLGAVLMVLAAVQAFSYRVPALAPPAVPALIALLGALALLLATLVLWLATPPGERGPGKLGSLLAGLVGGTAGWLAVTVTTHALTGRGSSVVLTWAVALPCFGCGWLFMRRRLRAGTP
ncbi:CATRA conflict system CASPASE/TPR repeat-associated protein [Streptomyces rhizosphaericola]|uniref:CATRA conflict system CASPASE/TPR repeat-associated protein n=1 Tax=Streptomyces rhizosphaericola TaxID=2564098 RepID=UPI0039EFBA7A